MGQPACSCCAAEHKDQPGDNSLGPLGGVHAPAYFAEDVREPNDVPEFNDYDTSVSNSDYGATSIPAYPDWTVFGSAALKEGAQLDVDAEIVRSISLASSLRGCGWLWRVRPEKMDEAQLLSLWETSAEAEGFDVFVSHTWVTPGYQKFLSMLLSSYWHYAMAAWLLAAVPLMILYIFDVLPMFILIRSNIDDYQVDIPCGPWIFFATFLSAICGLFGAPYVGSCFCRKSRCFYDAACVNQVDPMKRERGIYGIGGFLAVSRQLRILWSPPYLSRLWCVFEIAAYRTANPRGQIKIQPLFVERDVLAVWPGVFMLFVIFILSTTRSNLRISALALCACGFFPCFHLVRKGYQEQEQMFAHLAHFDLSAASCSSDYDRQFILSAVSQWYGSLDDFTAFVRGPLKEELMEALLLTGVPVQYCVLSVSPFLAQQLDYLAGLLNQGAPHDVVARFVFGQMLAVNMLAVCTLYFAFWLAKQFAKPRFESWALDYVQTLLILVLWVLCIAPSGFLVVRIYQGSLVGALAIAAVAAIILIATFAGFFSAARKIMGFSR